VSLCWRCDITGPVVPGGSRDDRVLPITHLAGVATILHGGKFTHSHVAFWLWAGLYSTTPFLVFGVWWANRRRDVPATSGDPLIPVGVSRVIAVLGGLSVLAALFLFLFRRAATVWPWMLTPLTARVIGSSSHWGSRAWRPGRSPVKQRPDLCSRSPP
jgi:hypothetical protein